VITMRLLRTLPTSRLLALLAAVVAVAAGGTAIALAAGGGGPVPPPKPLPNAVHDAVAAPAVAGITAKIEFTNKLVDSAGLQGGGPLLKGATGRLWLGAGHKLRLELQSDSGDAQIVSDGTTAWAYDPSSHTVYRAKLPQRHEAARERADERTPTVAQIRKQIAEVTRTANLSRAVPGDIAGRPAYTVRIAPRRQGGLLGGAALAWDAAKGVPLRAGVYAAGSRTPVLELEAKHIRYGTVPASVFAVTPPADAKIVDVDLPAQRPGRKARAKDRPAVTGTSAVAKALPFELAAPAKLAGLPRHEVRLADWKGAKAAVVSYGRGLGGILVVERPAGPAGRQRGGPQLPTVSIGGAAGEELDTALGTMVRFERDGVSYTVLGSVPPATARAAARGL
jgi:outer membrane lipoprotein-sorting protein